MPLSSLPRTAREAELKYNVVTEYPDFHLHSAAAKGNLALVHYALGQGQPVNSVLEGLLPLHAAASNGSEPVVSRLLDAGADVNAPRLPLRYNSEKTKNGSIIVGTAGCTPLHFAAANGHFPIVRLLLNRGADPHIGDKHGVRPEDVAADYGYHNIVDLLRGGGKITEPNTPPPNQPTSPSRSRILKVQRSIGDTLTMRRPSLSSLGGNSSRKESSDLNTELIVDQLSPQTVKSISYQRRPSLPTLVHHPSACRTFRRPSSAGEGAERSRSPKSPLSLTHVHHASTEPEINIGRAVHQEAIISLHKATSKYSLSNIFKKTTDASLEPGLHVASDSSARSDANPNRTRTLDDTTTPKVFNAAWYRARKSSEAVVSSPLALGTTIAREPSPDENPAISHAGSSNWMRSTSVPGTEATGNMPSRLPPHFVPVTPQSPPPYSAPDQSVPLHQAVDSRPTPLSAAEPKTVPKTLPSPASLHLVDRLRTTPSALSGKDVPISFQGINSRSEAQALVELVRQNILVSASTPPSPGAAPTAGSLADQLEVYGRTLRLEKHFARGEAQRIRMGELPLYGEADSDDGDEKLENGPVSPNSSSSDVATSPLGLPFIERRPLTRLVKSPPVRSALASLPSSHLEHRVESRPPAVRPRRHKPIANMSYLQHKHSLEARLNRRYGSGDIDLDEEEGVDEGDEFGILPRPDPKQRSSTIEIIETNPTPTESPASAEPLLGTTEPVFKEKEGSPIYQSPLANANAPAADRARAPVSKPNPLIPEYILPSENAFPPRSQITSRSDPSSPRPTIKKPPNVRRPSTTESVKSFPVARTISPPPRRSDDISGSPLSVSGSVRRFGLRSLVNTLTKR